MVSYLDLYSDLIEKQLPQTNLILNCLHYIVQNKMMTSVETNVDC